MNESIKKYKHVLLKNYQPGHLNISVGNVLEDLNKDGYTIVSSNMTYNSVDKIYVMIIIYY